MRPDVRRDFDFGRDYLGHLKAICGQYLIGEAPFEEDTQRATDLIVLKLDPIRVACRVRRSEFMGRYPDEFTVRANRPNGHETELAKIVAGWGDYMIYGFAGPPPMLAAWALLDLRVFRTWWSRQLWLGRHPGIEKPNRDGSSAFRAFTIGDLPDKFVVARKRAETIEAAA